MIYYRIERFYDIAREQLTEAMMIYYRIESDRICETCRGVVLPLAMIYYRIESKRKRSDRDDDEGTG